MSIVTNNEDDSPMAAPTTPFRSNKRFVKDASEGPQTDDGHVDIPAIEAQSVLFQTCISSVTRQLCEELKSLRKKTAHLDNELKQQQTETKEISRKYLISMDFH